MNGAKVPLSKPHPLEPSASLGVWSAPGRDSMAGEQTIHVDKATQRVAGGSEIGRFNLDLIDRTVARGRLNLDPNDPDAGRQAAQTSEAVVAAMRAFKPMDEVEAMIASQAVMLHHLAMEAGRRAMRSSQSPEIASELQKDFANAARGMADMVDALARHRGKSPQVIRIEKMMVVAVDAGGASRQGAMVTSDDTTDPLATGQNRGEGWRKPVIARALRRPRAAGRPLAAHRHGEWPVPLPRRFLDRSADGGWLGAVANLDPRPRRPEPGHSRVPCRAAFGPRRRPEVRRVGLITGTLAGRPAAH